MSAGLMIGHIYPLTPQPFNLLFFFPCAVLIVPATSFIFPLIFTSTIRDTMNNSFVQQFADNIKFNYTCFDRVIIRGYIRSLFFEAGVVLFLSAMGFRALTTGVMRILTDQLNDHIKKQANKMGIPVLWWPSVDGGVNGAKLRYVEKHYAGNYQGKENFVYCIIADKEPVRTFVARELKTKSGRLFHRLYSCRKPVKQYYIYFHDQVLGGPCYLKISSYLPFHSEFYFNGHNAIRLELDKKVSATPKKKTLLPWWRNRRLYKKLPHP